MQGPWFLFLAFVQAGHFIEEVSTDVMMVVDEDIPNCEELRNFWKIISSSARKSELSNEIPIIPWDMTPYFDDHSHRKSEKGRRKNYHHPTNSLKNNVVEDILLLEDTQRTPPVQDPLLLLTPQPHQEELHEHFEHLREDNPAFWKKGGSELTQSESWGLPEEAGMFGKFVDFPDMDFPLMPSRGRQPVEDWDRTHYGRTSIGAVQESCLQVLNKDCTHSENCKCIGWNALQCVHGKCTSQYLNIDTDNENEYWHDGPLPRSKLGRLKRPRRNKDFTFM